ncbi:hypothetical protein BHE74_00041773, partial [Ensete ventricosum]
SAAANGDNPCHLSYTQAYSGYSNLIYILCSQSKEQSLWSLFQQWLYTGIHALKPKSKGAICESTTALNVDQRITESTGKEPLLTTPLSTSSKVPVTNAQDQNASIAPLVEPVVGASAIQKKEGLAVKAQVDKKKIDARKKSLKRL